MAATADQMAGYTGRLDSEMVKWEKQVRRCSVRREPGRTLSFHGGALYPIGFSK